MGGEAITPLNPQHLLAPILPALPGAAVSTTPASGLLPLLSPILRQRVQLLSESSTEPWLRLLCYDISKAAKLGEAVRGGNLEPHPVSGEVEVDWSYDVQMRYKRVDEETFRAFVVMEGLGLTFLLVWCINDEAGGGDGWKVGEVSVPDDPTSPFSKFGGSSTISDAEQAFKLGGGSNSRRPTPNMGRSSSNTLGLPTPDPAGNDEDDDSYWAQYDATPNRTPAHSTKPSPAPRSYGNNNNNNNTNNNAIDDQEADDAYFNSYGDVQPAMDNHDPDEEMETSSPVAPPLGLSRATVQEFDVNTDHDVPNTTQPAWIPAHSPPSERQQDDEIRRISGLVQHHPRPESSASSGGRSATVNRLEGAAGRQEQNEFGVKQHVSRSIRSLFLLSQASGIDREEFEQMVRVELDLLGMMEDGS